jgi:putative ABC transport system permease protein
MKKKGFIFFFVKSVSQRMGRFFTASVSVMLAVAVITGISGLTYGIKEKLGDELRSYGANMIVSPLKEPFLEYDAIEIISRLPNVIDAEGQVYGRVSVMKESVEVIGIDPGRLQDRGWRLFGRLSEKEGEVLAGIKLKEALKLAEGDTVSLHNEGGVMNYSVSGFIESGRAEDNSFLMSLDDAWRLLGTDRVLSAVLVRGEAGETGKIADEIKKALSSVSVKTVRQVAVAEVSLLYKMQLLMILVSLIVLFAASVSVAGTVGANVIERRDEIGLMKALGATANNIRVFYIAESTLIGIVGGIDGFILGYIFTQAVSWKAFGSFITIPFFVVALSVLAGLLISLFASHFPVRDVLKYNPAVILRGE